MNLGVSVPNDFSGKLKQSHLFSWVTDSDPDLVWPEEENLDEERFVTGKRNTYRQRSISLNYITLSVNTTFSGSLGSIINTNWIIDDGS